MPHHGTEFNIGVEDGPDAILIPQFVAGFKDASVLTYTFPLPDSVKEQEYYAQIAKSSSELASLIEPHHKTGRVVMIGGDHSIALGSLLAATQAHGSTNVGIVQFDSHPDLNSIHTSPTGNFHGMWLRPFLDTFDDPAVNALIQKKILPSQMLYVGNLHPDPGEDSFMQEHHIRHIDALLLRTKPEQVRHDIDQFVHGFSHIHVTFDIDVFDRSVAAASGTPLPTGVLPQHVLPLLGAIRGFPSLSIDLVEVNPRKSGAESTVRLAQGVLRTLLAEHH